MAVDQSVLELLEPIAKLSAARKQELAGLCYIEKVNKNIDPMRMNVTKASQVLYVLKGDLGLSFIHDEKLILHGGSPAARHPVNNDHNLKATIALTDLEILRIDMDLLDIILTWDQLSSIEDAPKQLGANKAVTHGRTPADWMHDTSIFSVSKLQTGVFSRLPAANIKAMFKRMTHIAPVAGQVIIQQGAEGDYYYLIERGTAVVTKVVDFSQPAVVLAELNEGGAFGEEALASDNKRNATVTMKTDGKLFRLNKKDFVELLKAPLIKQVNWAEAEEKVKAGAVWADVRLPSEYHFDPIQGAINLPLNEIRQLLVSLDKNIPYITYCQTGRRSSAAAFILAQAGFNVHVLAGGTRTAVV
ncbi:MAG: cyclic nucleotide-binding protein [Methylotenera sp. RIFCSPLOWO2_02_FULL_45_14]|nr:MAG: cyclic nucleotide-binding protein [Methylotenera sp. RIFCSPLOWO2_02_FULL_45_14]